MAFRFHERRAGVLFLSILLVFAAAYLVRGDGAWHRATAADRIVSTRSDMRAAPEGAGREARAEQTARESARPSASGAPVGTGSLFTAAELSSEYASQRPLADGGDPTAQLRVAEILEHCAASPPDASTIIERTDALASAGGGRTGFHDRWAARCIGVPRASPKDIAALYLSAATAGVPRAMYAMSGRFPPTNAQHLEWKRRAARAGDARAALELAQQFAEGAPAERAEAMAWARIAARNGEPAAEAIARSLSEWFARATPAELEAATNGVEP